MNQGGPNKRGEKRIPYRNIIRYTCPAAHGDTHARFYRLVRRLAGKRSVLGGLADRVATSSLLSALTPSVKSFARAEDVSPNGLGLVTSERLEVGETLVLFDDRIASRPLAATVRWCSPREDETYRVGVLYNAVRTLSDEPWMRERAPAGARG